jgi:hypothetical protein
MGHCFMRRTDALGIACVRLNRDDLGARVGRAAGEVVQPIATPCDQRDTVTSDSGTAGDGHAHTPAGADQ